MGVRVYHILKEAIVTGEIPPGTWLLGDQLTHATGISRTPLREAFNRLKSNGLIDIIREKKQIP